MRNAYAAYPSFAMLAGMQLDLFTPLKDGPMEAKNLASALGVLEGKLAPLLYSLVAAGLLEVEDRRFSNTSEADEFLVRGRPNYIGGLSGFYDKLWRSTLNTAESIRTGKPQARIDWRTLPEEELLKVFRSQVHSSARGGKEIADKLDFSRFTMLLDAGGGTGGAAIAICKKYPRLKATVADFPKVVRLAERFIADAGMSDRIGVSATDLCQNPPEGKYDVAILRAVIQTLSKEQAQMALKCIVQSIVPGGRIYIFGSVLENSRLAPVASLAGGLAFLNLYDHGESYTENEYQEMLTGSGFTEIAVEHDALVDGMGIVSARRR
jgi:hypothetical protein